MFCFQCEQTTKGEGCTKIGVCGKQPDVAALQDLLIYAQKGLSLVAVEGRKAEVVDPAVDKFTNEAIFSTLTNVDFDPDRFVALISEAVQLREALKEKVRTGGGKADFSGDVTNFTPAESMDAMVAQGEKVAINADPDMDPDILGL
ncbi:MAG: hydroxylamine reductase, partial [Thermodesulfobacteriota bacterium]|nr:hydroxylamine reductase [Thermodesulfobacteriota bacterium]